MGNIVQPKICSDCAAEGNDAPQPPEAFYVIAGSLSKRCKRHHAVYVNAQKAARKAANPEAEAERQRAIQARYEQSKKGSAKHRELQERYRKRHPDAVADRYAEWVENNPDKRKATQDAYNERQKLRGVQRKPPRDPKQ